MKPYDFITIVHECQSKSPRSKVTTVWKYELQCFNAGDVSSAIWWSRSSDWNYSWLTQLCRKHICNEHVTQVYGSCLCPRKIIYDWNSLSQMWKFRFSTWISRSVTYFPLGTLAISFRLMLTSDTCTKLSIKDTVVTFSVLSQVLRWWMDKKPTEWNLLYKYITRYFYTW